MALTYIVLPPGSRPRVGNTVFLGPGALDYGRVTEIERGEGETPHVVIGVEKVSKADATAIRLTRRLSGFAVPALRRGE